ncbi:MAG: hypothetical protein QXL07_06475 [Fervidicoccaceae archaeon]
MFVFYKLSASSSPSRPPVIFTQPPQTYASIQLTSRGAITYTDFETYPLSGWNSDGGTWTLVSNVAGAKGNVLQGTDNNNGIGGESQYYYSTSLTGYSNLWIISKTRLASNTGWYGVALINNAGNKLFVVEIEATGSTTGYLQIWSYNVVVNNVWSNHASVAIPGYSQAAWYTIVVNYSVSRRAISITAYLYDASGNYVTSASATITSTNVFTPAYIGVSVDDVSAYFDEFIISTVDPRTITIQNLSSGMYVEIRDSLGNLVSSGTASSSQLSLSVVSDFVVGTGSGGSISIYSSQGGLLLAQYTAPTTSAILGGDSYSVVGATLIVNIAQANTSASIYIYTFYINSLSSKSILNITVLDTVQYYASLSLSSYSLSSNHSGSIYLLSQGGASSTSITFSSGIPGSYSTSEISLLPGSGNAIIASISSSGSGTSSLNLNLIYCTISGGQGACVYYPITVQVIS